MYQKSNRRNRISREIYRSLSIIFYNKICDPRIKKLFISNIELSKDYSVVKVFIKNRQNYCFKKKKDCKINVDFLNRIHFIIRKYLKNMIYIKIIPKLIFFYDTR